MGGRIWVDKRVLLRHSGSYVFCMENQEHLMKTIGPMYVEEQAKKAPAVAPDATGVVSIATT
jgi:hypothetical protein